MYNNFSSKKTKKVISALLASALVVTSGPITADAATAKVVGIKKSITVSASATNKVTGLSKAEKKIVKVTKKGKKFTIKGLKAGKATFKIGKKSYTVKVGATTVKAAKTKLTLTKGKAATLKFTTKSGNGDTLTFKASNKNVTLAKKSAKIAKSVASVKATAKKAGKTTITATSKATGKKATVTVTVKNAAKPAATTPGASNTPVATATGSATNTPEATATATATASGSATNTPDVTATATATGSATATPVATGSATNTPEATEVPTEAPTKAPEVVTGGTITVTTNVSGASIKVVSGTTVIAETATTATTAAIKNIANGTYTVVVSANGCNDETKLVTVKGDVAVDFVLSAKTLNVTGVTAEDTQGKALSLDKVTKNGVIKVAFDSAVDKDTVNSATFKITDAAGTPIGIPSTDIKLDASGKTVSVSFDNTSLEKKKSYTLTVANVKSTDGLTAKESKTTFTVADVAVVKSIKSYTSVANANSDTSGTNLVEDKNAATGSIAIVISYDEAIDSATTIASNITLLDVAKNEKKAIKDITKDGKKVILTFDAALTDGKQYTLTTSNIKTSIGADVEDYKLTFAVAGERPTAGVPTVTTLDNINLFGGDKAWPLLTAGTHETNATSTYYAGHQLKVQFKQKLDKASAEKYIKLVDAKEDTFVDATVVYDEASKMATITPAKDLKEGAAYRVVVLGGLKTVQGIYMDYDKQDTEKETLQSFETLEITSPKVVNVESTDGLVNLNPKEDHIFTVTFSKPVSELKNADYKKKVLFVKSNTSAENYVSVSNSYGVGNVDIAAVPGTDNKSYTIKIKAGTKALDYDGAYKLIIVGEDLCEDTGIAKTNINCDTSNNTLKTSTNVVFTTAALDKTGPVVSKVYSGTKIDAANEITSTKTNVIAGDSMVFEFNEELKAGDSFAIDGRKNGTILLENYDGKTGAWNKVDSGISAIAYVANADSKKVAVKVTFGSGLTDDGKYRVVFKENSVYDNADTKGDQSADGYNGLEKEFKFEFIGSNNKDTNVAIKAGTIDENSLTAEESGELSAKAKFVVAFEEKDITTVKAENIVVQDENGNVVAGKIAEKEITYASGYGFNAGKIYVFTPDNELKTSTVYTITVDGVKDVAGNAIAKKVVQLKTADADVKVGDISIANNATSVDRQKTITIALTDKADSVNHSYNRATDNGKTNVVVTLTKSAGGDATGRANVALSDDGKSVKLTFGNADGKKLEPNTAYTLTVKTQKGDDTADDNRGAYVDIADSTKTIKFTTGVVATDDVAPTYVSATAGNVSLTKDTVVPGTKGSNDIVLTFDEGVKKDNLKVTITNMTNSTGLVEVLGSTLSKTTVDNDTVTISTAGFTTANQTYKITISGITDDAGNEVDTVNYYVSFTPAPTTQPTQP